MTPDLTDLAQLPTLTVEAGDLDLVELVQLGLVPPSLRLGHSALAALDGVEEVVVRDVEATPLLLARHDAGTLSVTPLRPVAGSAVGEPSPRAGLVVVVRDMPNLADLARVDALTPPRATVVWLVLAGRTKAGRRLLAELPDVLDARPHGEHTLVRVPWPAPGTRGVFERPELPTVAALGQAYGTSRVVAVGDGHAGEPPRKDRGGTVVFFTGLSGSGKSTIARALHDALEQRTEREVTLLDGDDVRRMLSAGLGFDAEGRAANVRRVSWVAAMLARHGGIAITALIAPFAEGRADARRMAEDGAEFVEVWVSTPLQECERRDRKGLYAQARAGRLTNFTGIDSPYEVPTGADLVIDTTTTGVTEAVELVVAELEARALRRGEEFAPPERAEAPAGGEVLGYDI